MGENQGYKQPESDGETIFCWEEGGTTFFLVHLIASVSASIFLSNAPDR